MSTTPPLPPPSDEFLDAVQNGASLVVQCDPCGRTYFAHAGDYTTGELEELRAQAEAEPDRYVETADFTHWGVLGGKRVVLTCCLDYLRRYEDFIWGHRMLILDYLRAMARRRERDAVREAAAVERVHTLKSVLE